MGCRVIIRNNAQRGGGSGYGGETRARPATSFEPSRRKNSGLGTSSAIKLLLYETGGEAALSGVRGERSRRAADVTGTAQEDHRCPANVR
jgi:hypothetical protein